MGTLGGPTSQAYDVNAAGTVTGCADGPTGRRIFRWTSSGGMVLGDTYSGSTGSCGYGINRLQNVAGYFFGSGNSDTAAVFDATGFPLFPYRLGDGNYAAVNDNGVAAGRAPFGGVVQGVAFDPARGLSILPSFRAGAEAFAFDINLCGRIVGWGYSRPEGGGPSRALLWIPPGC